MTMHRKAVALMDPIEAVARLAARAGERAEAAQTRASGSASYDNGDGTRTVIGPQTGSATMATHVGDTTPPGRPLGVAGASSAGVVYIAWDGRLEGGIPADFDHVTCYMTVDGVDEAVGTLTEAGIVSTVPMATATTVEVWATAEDDACLADGTPAHNISAESDHATVAVTQGEDAAAVDALRERVSAVEAKADSAKSAAATAQSTANAAKGTADSLATMIREDATGITVGKSADGQTYSTGRTHMDEDSFDVLDKAGSVLSSFGKNLIELGKNSMDATISMLAGLVKIQARNDGSNTVASVSSDFLSLDSLWKAVMRAGKGTGGAHVEGYAAAIAEVTGRSGTARLYCTQGNGSRVTANNAFTVLPDGYDLGRPEYLAAALLGTGGGGTGITHSQDAVTMAPDLDACGPGVFSYNASTANRPTDYGTCVCIRAGDGTDTGTWLFQVALPTSGDPHWRRNINGAGWEGWWTITSQ